MDETQVEEKISQLHQEMSKQAYPYLIDNGKYGKEGQRYQARDLSPAIFARAIKELYPERISTVHLYRAEKEGDRRVLRSFSKTALESGDVENALEGFRRLDDLNNPELVAGLKKTIETLRQSKDPKDQLRLRTVVTRVQELKA